MAIRSFRTKVTLAVFRDEPVRGLAKDIRERARAKLLQINAAEQIEDLFEPPGNRLKALRGDRAGQHSVRVNAQWRICFVWRDGHAFDVELVDYH